MRIIAPSFTSPSRFPVYRMAAWLLLAMLGTAFAPARAAAGATQDTWFTVLLDGRKVGHAHFTRSSADGQVTTRQKVHLEVSRAGTMLAVDTMEQDLETESGKPLGFRTVTRLSGSTTSRVGRRLADGRFEVTRKAGGSTRTETISMPTAALLAEGQRLATQRAGRTPGTTFEFTAWDAAAGRARPVQTRVVGVARVSLPGGAETLLRIDQHMPLGTGGIDSSMWLDDKSRVRRLRTTMLGMRMELLACDRRCALAPNQGVDILDQAMVALPRALTRAERRGPVTWELQAVGTAPLHITATDEQQVTALGAGRWQVHVGAAIESREAPPEPADSAANDWLQADAPALRELARKAVAGVPDSAAARMPALERFVAAYITDKSLAVGYASALEVLRSREGDCTEHAVLLAALARALGIPARVVSGLVYAPRYAGRRHVLVPHAWVQAWVDRHWRSFDAAQRGFDSGHIALQTGDGDPWHFFDTVNTLGRISVTKIRSGNP